MIITSVLLFSITEFIGHFHPLLVHLPIGILLFAALLHVISRKKKFEALKPAVRIALFWGMLSAVASCISGFILSGLDDYDETLVATHQWLAIATAFVSLCVYFLSWRDDQLLNWLMLLMVLLIIITGHLGGSLTHGSDYLLKAFSNKEEKIFETKALPNAQEAIVYADIIQPLLQSKCYTCHGANKKKGGLRLDQPGFILKGGKDGKVIKPGSAEESDMIKRLMLPRNHEDHMPPKEKSQLKESEISLIHWWIATGASFDKKTKELEQPGNIKTILFALQKEEKKILPDVPATEVAKANEDALQKLKQRGVAIVPVSQNSNYLSANFVTVDSLNDKDLELLIPLKNQLIWLNLNGKKIADDGIKSIGQLKNLIRLQLNNTLITDKGLASLQTLSELQYLSLAGTKVTGQGILELKGLQKLQTVYVYKTEFTNADLSKVQSAFPKTKIDTGGYTVPFVSDDTTELKAPKTIKN
jgi:mono/diheme cytochrome c family protein